MAGPFGFERDKQDVFIICDEPTLLPTVQKTVPDTLIIANGFS